MFPTLLLSLLAGSTTSHVGPIPHPTDKVTVAPGRVEAKAIAPKLSPAKGIGKWIWLDGDHASVRFLRKIEVDQLPKSGVVRITSECSYRLYVNGQIVARGPADVGRDYDIGPTGPWLYDVVDIRRWLKKGDNWIGVEVVGRRLVQSEGTLGKPGLWAEIEVDQQTVGSDASWLAEPNSELRFAQAKPGEPLHQRGEFLTLRDGGPESRWMYPHPNGWSNAKLQPSAERPLRQSEIPPPMEAVYPSVGIQRPTGGVRVGTPTMITADGSFAVRFDRVLSAHIVVRVNGGKGAVLTLMPNERNEPGYHRAIRLELGEGSQTFEVPFFDSFSVINVQATGVTSPIEIASIEAVFRSYPVQYKGSFECSDPKLNRIWEIGRWSTQICMQTHHLDSPHHQEPISDPGDYLIESLINFYTFGEPGLAKQDLRKYAQIIRDRKSRVFHTSYALLWLQMLMEYHRYTGDAALVRELAPTVELLLESWESWRGPNGIVSNPPNFMFIDWVEIEGFNLHHPPAVIGQGCLSAFYYRALEDGIAIADLLGKKELARTYQERRYTLKRAFQSELWSEERQMFRDGKPGQSSSPLGQWLPADKQMESFSSQVNLLAAAYGLVPEGSLTQLVDKVMASGPANLQPYFMHFGFDALAASGRFNEWATKQFRRWKPVEDTQTFPEMWDRGDLSHAWQCTPTYQMSARVLGVTPTSPGFKTVLIQPHPCDLTWAKGSVPTPKGPVKVEWKLDGGKLVISATVPKGCQAKVVFPNGTTKTVGPGNHFLEQG